MSQSLCPIYKSLFSTKTIASLLGGLAGRLGSVHSWEGATESGPHQCLYLKGAFQGNGARLFSVTSSKRARDNGQKPMHREFLLNMRKNFNIWLTEQWNRLSREGVRSSSLEILKNNLSAVLCNVLQDDPTCAGRLDQMTHYGPFQPYTFCNSEHRHSFFGITIVNKVSTNNGTEKEV